MGCVSWKAAATQVLVNTLRKAGLSLTPTHHS